jgi:flagellar hook-length control protein FliK
VIVRFQTDSADTAQAIEDNQLRLRENLQRAGLSLLNFAVSQGEQPNAG